MREDIANLLDALAVFPIASRAFNEGDHLFTKRHHRPLEPRPIRPSVVLRPGDDLLHQPEPTEAIRPTGGRFRRPDQLDIEDCDQRRLYALIWKRTVACQKADAERIFETADVEATVVDDTLSFCAKGRRLSVPGHLLTEVWEAEEPLAALADTEKYHDPMPECVREGGVLAVDAVKVHEKHTNPPRRYTEGSLIKTLKAHGIGRPSTHGQTIDNLTRLRQQGPCRSQYARRQGRTLVPTIWAFAAVEYLEEHVPELVDTAFTGVKERKLDAIADGALERAAYLGEFYHGTGADRHTRNEERNATRDARNTACHAGRVTGFGEQYARLIGADDKQEARRVHLDGLPDHLSVRTGYRGPYTRRDTDGGFDTASLPDDQPVDELDTERLEELVDLLNLRKPPGPHPDTGEPVVLRAGQYGFYLKCGSDTASLPDDIDPETFDRPDALRWLSLPRPLGPHPDADGAVTAGFNRYGPYVRLHREDASDVFANLDDPEALLEITLEEALAILPVDVECGDLESQ